MTTFGKLVRDRIPKIIEAEGRRPLVEVLRSLAEQAGISVEQIVERAEGKGVERGRFRERLFLVRVDPEP